MPRLDAIGLVVADLQKSADFYVLLGVPTPASTEGPHWESTLPNGLRLMWDTEELIREIDPSWQKPSGQNAALAFLCESPTEVDATYAKALQAGHRGHKAPWDAFWGQRYAQLIDPDGNHVDLFAPL
jgi:catechol 2,3-dioxygenase-like lactoylglutathione lyase family enzyme